MITQGHISTDRSPSTEGRRAKLRLAIGLFGSQADARLTANELTLAGIAPARVHYVSAARSGPQPIAAGQLAAPAQPVDGAPTAFGRFTYIPTIPGAGCLTDAPAGYFEPCGPFASDAHAADARLVSSALTGHLGQRSLIHQEQQLREHLKADGCLLVVRLLDLSEQYEVCTILLRRARGGVQTHEIRRS